jgi:hypothetical protein
MSETTIFKVPSLVIQSNVLSLFTSRELFTLRGVCGEFSDMTKQVWCQVVKYEMLQQV